MQRTDRHPLTSAPSRNKFRPARAGLAVVSAAALATLAAPSAIASPVAQPSRPIFGVGALPGAKATFGQMTGTAVLSAKNVWSVGGTDQPGQSNGTTLVQHWDGSTWTRVKSPNLSKSDVNDLDGISAVSASDIWASGTAADASGDVYNLMEHWNGTKWSMVTVPDDPNSTVNYLQGVSADSAKDAWAAADYVNASGVWIPYTEHWNGHKWSIVDASQPTGSLQTFALAVVAIAPGDAWLVGQCIEQSGVPSTVVEHWDGSQWSVVKSPNPTGAEASGLSAVTAVSSSDVWAVGNGVSASGVETTLIEHWNGTKWSISKSPNPKSGGELAGVSAAAADDVWAVGSANTSSGSEATLTERWTGKKWSIVSSPNVKGAQADILNGVSATGVRNAWATGASYTASGTGSALNLRWNGKTWTISS